MDGVASGRKKAKSAMRTSNGKEKGSQCFNKKEMVKEYINLLGSPQQENISDLKIFKNDNDYTGTLNKFLYK